MLWEAFEWSEEVEIEEVKVKELKGIEKVDISVDAPGINTI
jgi:hypothetical protein